MATCFVSTEAANADRDPCGDLRNELDGLPTLRRGQQFPLVAVEECSIGCRIVGIAVFLEACEQFRTWRQGWKPNVKVTVAHPSAFRYSAWWSPGHPDSKSLCPPGWSPNLECRYGPPLRRPSLAVSSGVRHTCSPSAYPRPKSEFISTPSAEVRSKVPGYSGHTVNCLRVAASRRPVPAFYGVSEGNRFNYPRNEIVVFL